MTNPKPAKPARPAAAPTASPAVAAPAPTPLPAAAPAPEQQPELELKRLTPVVGAATSAATLAGRLYVSSKAYVPERLQGPLAAAEGKVTELVSCCRCAGSIWRWATASNRHRWAGAAAEPGCDDPHGFSQSMTSWLVSGDSAANGSWHDILA